MTVPRRALAFLAMLAAVVAVAWTESQDLTQEGIRIDYPLDGSIFPPDFASPTFLWRDPDKGAVIWRIDVSVNGRTTGVQAIARGEPMTLGEIDPRCIGPTNRLPQLSPEQAAAHTWKPDADTWAAIKRVSAAEPAVVTITGYGDQYLRRPLSGARITIRTSRDPVGAPIFYRDVPLMPAELEKGVIKPIPPRILPVIAWRLRDVAEPAGRVVMEGLHTCANCHSFSRDGKILGMDLDGPHNDKGLYTLVPLKPRMSIENEHVISWKSFRGQTGQDKRIGFMSQVSPSGEYVITATQVEYYVANFKDYRFLQVFYPTRGILAWYSRSDGRMRALPGADDPRYVQANAVWTPDGRHLIFARAAAAESYPAGRKMAEYAGDPNEVPIKYDLYRIPFNDGNGGQAMPIPGASSNGMSNSFPKVSPDGRWIVFVMCGNGQLMRPDGRLYIVPAAGGPARRMKCNMDRMNSWHSFSPNGRWMVFSSKSRSPYTQMFLTHIDEEGNDSPAILIENSTAANRAVNIPEFVNIPADALLSITAPATEFYRLYDRAWDLTEKGQIETAIEEWTKALELDPEDARARNNFAALLLRQGKLDQAAAHFQKVLELNPEFTNVRNNLGVLLLQTGRVDAAIEQFRTSLGINPDSIVAHANLGNAYAIRARFREARNEWEQALRLQPKRTTVLSNLAWLLATCPDSRIRNGTRAVELAGQALVLAGADDPLPFDVLGAACAEAGRFPEAVDAARRAITLAQRKNETGLLEALKARIALYQAGKPFRER